MRSGHSVSFSTGILDPIVIVNKEVLLLLKEVIHLLKEIKKIFTINFKNMYFVLESNILINF